VSKKENREAQGVREDFISKKSFDLILSRSHKCKECVGDQKTSKESSLEGIAKINLKKSKALNISQIISQDLPMRERDHSRS
jgi:hypothetical protein